VTHIMRSFRAGALGLLVLVALAACVVGGYGGGGYVDEGYVGGVYESGGYDYGGWGPGYRVGPPGWHRGPGPEGRPGGGRPPPSIPHGVHGGGPHGGGGRPGR
jgi:hypothetical protein